MLNRFEFPFYRALCVYVLVGACEWIRLGIEICRDVRGEISLIHITEGTYFMYYLNYRLQL